MRGLKEKYAIMSIFFCWVEDFVINADFNHEHKYHANRAVKHIKWLLNKAYKGEPMEEFDNYKEKVIEYAHNVVNGNFHLKGEKNDFNERIIKSLSKYTLTPELLVKELTEDNFKIIEL